MHKLQHTKRNYITCDKNLRLLLFSKFLLRIYSERSIIVWFSSHRCVVLERYSPFPLLYASRRETVFFPYNGTISVEFLFFFFPVSPELYVRLMLYSLRPTVTFWNIETQNIHMYLLYHFAYNLIQFGEYKNKLFSACLTFLQILQCNSYNGAAHTHIRSHTWITRQKHRIIVNIIFDLLNSIV